MQWADLSAPEGFENLIEGIRSVLGDVETSELGTRAKILYDGHLIQVRVTDQQGVPLAGAQVELNEIESRHILVIHKGIQLKAQTGDNGTVYFGLPNESEHISMSAKYVVSATTTGFGFAHEALLYGQMKFIARLIRYPKPAVVFSNNEVGEREPDESVELKLERKTEYSNKNSD